MSLALANHKYKFQTFVTKIASIARSASEVFATKMIPQSGTHFGIVAKISSSWLSVVMKIVAGTGNLVFRIIVDR
jgi:hypothetical protein